VTPDRRLLLAAVIAWLVVAVLGIVLGPPLGHDEAAFAVSARGGGPPWVYRSAGVTEVARIGVLLGGATWQLRIASALFGTLIVVGAYAAGTAAFSARTGAWAAAVIAGAHPMALRSAELIGDLPATGCLLVGIALLAAELAREDGPRWRLVIAGPAFAIAFYLRYASAPVILIASVAAAALWWRAILRRPLPVLAAGTVFVLLLLPHVVQSLAATGKLFGILQVSASMPRRAYPGEGLVSYLTPDNPFRYYGALVAPLLIAGIVGFVRAPARWRPSIFLGVVALGQVLAIGLQSHAQPRYIFVAIVLLVVLGIDALSRFAPPKLRIAALPLVALAWLGVVITVPLYSQFLAEARAPLVAAATAVRTDAAGAPCLVVSKVVTQLMWHTRCAEHRLTAPEKLPRWSLDRRIYVVSIPRATISIEGVREARPALVRELPVAPPARAWRVLPAPTVPGF
jgi:4-amino-4-deoxy-L-arabinose transferase-like glycosyltransferase